MEQLPGSPQILYYQQFGEVEVGGEPGSLTTTFRVLKSQQWCN